MGRAGSHPACAPPLLLLLLLLRAERLPGAELTFELPDSAKQCFHEDVERGARFSLDYQVRPAPAAPAPGVWGPLSRVYSRAPVGGSGFGVPFPRCSASAAGRGVSRAVVSARAAASFCPPPPSQTSGHAVGAGRPRGGAEWGGSPGQPPAPGHSGPEVAWAAGVRAGVRGSSLSRAIRRGVCLGTAWCGTAAGLRNVQIVAALTPQAQSLQSGHYEARGTWEVAGHC
uniref:transmembrane emp24 domain-containing protein 3 isoform X1 n=1 Tax=Halichoerus grypus TaxID=9711 RepID=UPI0016595AA2|nr:transmembrane emp24 domain-containing protein 3 isoform X1 [Halichoerus grypus]